MEDTPAARPDFSLPTAAELLDSLPWGVFVLDEQRVVRQVNRQAAAWCGVAPGALLGQPLPGAALPGVLALPEATPHEVYLPGPGQWLTCTARRRPGGWVLYGHDSTSQRQREQQHQALAASEAWFRTLANLVPDLLWRSSPDSNTTWYNQRWYDYTGQTPAAAANYGWTNVIHPDDRVESSRRYQAAVADGQLLRQEHRIRSAQGEYRWFQVQAQPLLDAHGTVTAWVGAATDVHARKLAELHLTAATAAADALRLALADALGPLTDPVAVQAAVTRLARRHFGADRCYYCEIENGQALIRRDAATKGLPSVAGTYQLADFTALQAAVEAGRPFWVRDVRQDAAVDEGLRRLCGQLQVVAYLNVPIVKHGQPVGLLSLAHGTPRTWTDADAALAAEVADRAWAAAERARTEQALRESEAKYRTLFDSLDEGICLTEVLFEEQGRATNYRFVEVNAAFERQTGIVNPVGRLATDVAPNVEPAWLETVGNVARTGTPLHTEAYFTDPDRWYSLSLHRVGGAGSRLLGSIFDDITARKRHEAQQNLLLEIGDDMARLTRPEEIMQAVGARLGRFLRLGTCVFVDVQEERGEVTARYGWHQEGVSSLRETYRFADYVGEEFARDSRANKLWVIRDTATDPRVNGEALARLHVGAWLAVPFHWKGRWTAHITVTDPAPRDWQDDEMELVRNVADRVFPRMERSRAEEALHQSQEQFRLFVTASSDALYRLDAHWQHLLRLNGKGFLADTEAPGTSWLDAYIPPADQAAVGEVIRAAIAGPHFFELEHRVLRADGSVGWAFSRALPVLDERGELVEWFGTATDVTARKQAEELAQQSVQQRALFAAVQAAQEAERKRIAESLHNGIGQLLYAIKLRLNQSRALAPGPSAAAQVLRQETDALLTDAIRQARALSHELVPLALEEFGLPAALQDIGRELTAPPLILRSHVALDEAAAPMSPPLQMALYRIAQELALNIVRHAHGATEASLELETMPGWVLLRATDNGPGFAATPAAGPGLGLRSIRDRVTLLGGQLQTGNVPTGGAYVRIRIPLSALPA